MSINFATKMPWAGITDVVIDGQAMVKIPKFYVRCYTPASGAYSGKLCREISDAATDGFHVHPAFMKAGAEIDQFYVGKYIANDAGSSKAGSVAGTKPLCSITATDMTSRCTNRNTGGVTGFHKMSVYEYAAIQLLALTELGTPNVQTAIGYGSQLATAGTSNAVWHGIYDLWGNVYCSIDGIQGSGTTYQVWDNQGNQTYQTMATVANGSGWIVDTHTADSTSLYNSADLFLPKTLDGTESNGSFGDYQWGATTNFVVYVGGDNSYSVFGLFAWNLGCDAASTGSYYGFRLAKW